MVATSPMTLFRTRRSSVVVAATLAVSGTLSDNRIVRAPAFRGQARSAAAVHRAVDVEAGARPSALEIRHVPRHPRSYRFDVALAHEREDAPVRVEDALLGMQPREDLLTRRVEQEADRLARERQ